MACGIAVAGNPYFWRISGQRLYLFSREKSRDAFAADTASIVRPTCAGRKSGIA
jgi:hypothetical protein